MIKITNQRISLIQKICLAGLFIALTTICQKVLAINYIQVVPFVRISFGGTALIIVSSFLLGPWFGLLIGVASDLLGYLIFDPKTLGFFPQITAIYALLGLSSFFVFQFVRLFKNKRTMRVLEFGVFACLFILCSLFVCLNNEIKLYNQVYQINLLTKILVPIISFLLLSVLALFIVLFDRKHQSNDDFLNVYQISFSCFVLDIFVMVLFGSLMKGFAFGFQTYLVILISQIIVSFINIPLNTLIVSYIMLFTRKYID